ncbi:MAG: hypothetical protein RIG77_00785 [Cyclobacteriaceae bacterium]
MSITLPPIPLVIYNEFKSFPDTSIEIFSFDDPIFQGGVYSNQEDLINTIKEYREFIFQKLRDDSSIKLKLTKINKRNANTIFPKNKEYFRIALYHQNSHPFWTFFKKTHTLLAFNQSQKVFESYLKYLIGVSLHSILASSIYDDISELIDNPCPTEDTTSSEPNRFSQLINLIKAKGNPGSLMKDLREINNLLKELDFKSKRYNRKESAVIFVHTRYYEHNQSLFRLGITILKEALLFWSRKNSKENNQKNRKEKDRIRNKKKYNKANDRRNYKKEILDKLENFPKMTNKDIAKTLKIHRNTVSKYRKSI